MIKYYFQEGLGFHHDKKNCGIIIIENNLRKMPTRKELENILQKDGVSIHKVDFIKYWNIKTKAWIEYIDKQIGDVKLNNEFKLLIKYRPDDYQIHIPTPSSIVESLASSNQNYSNLELLSRKIIGIELKIKELEQKLNSILPIMHLSELNHFDMNLSRKKSSALGIPSQVLHRYNSSFMEQNLDQIEENQDSTLDIALLYSNPLIKSDNHEKEFALSDPIDYENEIKIVKETLENSGKNVSIQFEIANLNSIRKILLKKPKILHISCHGEYEEVNGEERFFLHFEDNDGKLEKFDTQRIRKIFKSDYESQISLVFVSACFSEPVAEVFIEAGVPVVVCVHSATKVLDEVAQKFAESFYEGLLAGNDIKYSFDHAKKFVSAQYDIEKNNTYCCCSHTHKKNCQWNKKKKERKYQGLGHYLHTKDCKCAKEQSHIHDRMCSWANTFIHDFQIEDPPILDGKFFKVCCCSPEISHGESDKFLIKGSETEREKKLFKNLMKGEIEIKNQNSLTSINYNINIKNSIIGRNMDLYKLIKILSNTDSNKNRLITIFGANEIGKSNFIKMAGKYMFERQKFIDGVYYIDNRDNESEIILINKICNCLNLENQIIDIMNNKKFYEVIKELKILFLLNFSEQSNENTFEFKNFITKIMKHTINPKFLVCSEFPLNLKEENKIELKPLNDYYTAKLLLRLSERYIPSYLRNCEVLSDKPLIRKHIQGKIKRVYYIAQLLQEGLKYEELEDHLQKENLKRETVSQELVQILIKNINSTSTLEYELLFLLSILPDGLMTMDLDDLYKDKYNEVITILDQFTQIVDKTYIEDDYRACNYKLDHNLKKSIETQIESSIIDKKIRNIIKYYSVKARTIINNLLPNIDSVKEFSAIQNYGIWSNIVNNYEIGKNWKFTKEFIKKPEKYFQFIERNYKYLFQLDTLTKFFPIEENFNNKDEVLEHIEETSICLPTILKVLNRKEECLSYVKNFLSIFESYKRPLAKARLLLFLSGISITPINNQLSGHILIENINKNIENILTAIDIFKECDYKEGEAESYFMKAVIQYENRFLNMEELIKNSFEDIIKYLEKALNIYKQMPQPLGYARVYYIISVYFIDNYHLGEEVLSYLQEAEQIFKEHGRLYLEIKCIINRAKWYKNVKEKEKELRNLEKARDLAELSNVLAQRLKNKTLESEVKNLLSDIFDLMEVETKNIFVFIKAHPLIKVTLPNTNLNSEQEDSEVHAGSIISQVSEFRNKLMENLKKYNKEIYLKFDYLTKKSFEEVMKKGGRILHLAGDDYNKIGSLFVEGKSGESEEIDRETLNSIFVRTKCIFDLVIIAIPQSRKLGDLFSMYGASHVICFDFDDNFLQSCIDNPTFSIFNCIHEFTVILLDEVLKGNTISTSFKHAETIFQSTIKDFAVQLNRNFPIFEHNLTKAPYNTNEFVVNNINVGIGNLYLFKFN